MPSTADQRKARSYRCAFVSASVSKRRRLPTHLGKSSDWFFRRVGFLHRLFWVIHCLLLLKSPGWRFVPRTGMRGVETSDVTFLAPGFVLAELLTSMVADSGFFRDLGPQPDAD